MKKLLLLLSLCALVLPASAALPGPTSASFARGAKFTVSGYTGASTLSGFPVLVRIAENSPSGFSYDDLQSKATGDDIAFVDMDGTGLPFEIDTWDPNGTSLIWVRLPSMQSGTEFVMCWGSDSSGRAVCAAKPWADYTGVWHMNEETAGVTTIHDSTANALHGTTVSSSTSKTDGRIGRARFITSNTVNTAGNPYDSGVTVDMTNDQTKLDAVNGIVPEFTASFWVRPQHAAQWWYFITRKASDVGPGWGLQQGADNDFTKYRAYGGNETDSTCATLSSVNGLAQGTWTKIDAVWMADKTFKLYVNGNVDNVYQGTLANQAANGNQSKLALGGAMGPTDKTKKNGRGVYGDMDEIRLRAGALSEDWIAADYATQTSPSFLTAGMAEPYEETDDPVAGVQVSDVAYTNATVTATVVKRGGAATSADVTVELSAASDFASSLWTTNYTVSADGDVQVFPVTGLSVGTSYYVRAVVSNTLDAVLTTPATSFATLMPGAPAGTATFLERGFTTLSATGAATAFGTGAQSATMFLQASKSTNFATIVSGSGVAAVLGEPAELVVSGLEPGANYNLRVCISNDWGLQTFVELPSAATREVPFAVTGIGWTFSQDGSTVDVTFGVSGVYDGATGTATLYYGTSPNPTDSQGGKSVDGPDTLTWAGLPFTADPMHAKVVLSAVLDGRPYSQSWTAPIAAGSTAVSVTDFANHQATTNAVLLHVGDVATLPEISGAESYFLGNRLFGSLDGNVLTALRPGILAVRHATAAGPTNTLPVIILPEVGGNGEIYVFDETCTGNNVFAWDRARTWWKVAGNSGNKWPQNPDDVAIFPFFDKNVGYALDLKNVNVTIGALYAGKFKELGGRIYTREQGTGSRIRFERTDGKPIVLQMCPNHRSATFTSEFSWGPVRLEYTSDVVLSGGWDGSAGTWPKGRMPFGGTTTNAVPAGTTFTIVEFDATGTSMGSTFELGHLVGGATVWNRSSANVKINGSKLAAFAGLLRDSSHGNQSVNRSGPIFLRTASGTNVLYELDGFVPKGTDGRPQNNTSGVALLCTGWENGYGSDNTVLGTTNFFPGRGLVMHGGTFNARDTENSGWGVGKAEYKRGALLAVTNGFNYIARGGDQRSNNAGHPINWVEFDRVSHDGKATLFVWDRSRFNPPVAAETNFVFVLHGISSHAVGPAGDCLDSAAHPVVPWLAGPKDSQNGGWNNFAFGSFDSDGRLVKPVLETPSSLDAATPGVNVELVSKNLEISSDATVNSLILNNQNKGKTLGADRTLTVSSGGLIFCGNACAVGEAGNANNGSLVLGDADHPAYVWAKSESAAQPNEIWAPITAPGGFVAAYTGFLTLGGDQTGIDDELVVNAGSLTLGSATTPCRLAKNLPIRLYANATLKLPNADSTAGKLLYFDGAAGWFGKVEIAEGVATKCKKAYWRDYPETPDWQSLPRGVYGSSASSATGDFVRDDLFAGAGTLQVVSDDCVDPTILILR